MKKFKIALKPYLDTISGFCDSLSNEELKDIIISLSKDISTSGRVEFLEKIESCLPGRKSAIMPDTNTVEQILNDIEALRESIEERIESIENGSYWDDPDVWGEDGYFDEEPDYVSGDQVEALESLFDDAGSLFLDDRLEDARKVYGALFNMIDVIKEEAYYSPRDEIDIREDEIEVGSIITDPPYPFYLEEGTRYMKPRPHMGPTLEKILHPMESNIARAIAASVGGT